MTTKKKTVVRPKRLKTAESPSNKYVSNDDRITNLESSMSQIASVMERVEARQIEQGKIPRVESDDVATKTRLEALKQVTKDGDMGESKLVIDLLNPRGQDSGFQKNDVVSIGENSAHYKSHLVNDSGELAKEEGKPALGVVLAYMYTRRDGQRKYKVNFPKIGKSSFMEKELVLVKAA